MSASDPEWAAPTEFAPRSEADGLDSAILRATVRARLFDAQPYRIGRFTVLRQLGEGGMGRVYLAYDPELEREVAIKVLRDDAELSETDSDRANSQVRREAQAMAKLRHPNVVVVHEVGEHDGGLFVAMEYVRGGTLRRWQTAERRQVHDIVATYVAAGRGLVAAHDAGLVHRDFKPDNVLVGDDGRVLVTDFGLARNQALANPGSGGVTDGSTGTITVESSTAGTPVYMAPECLAGRPATAASDQFSFCVALYEALWGARPFPEPLIGSPASIRDRHDRLDPPGDPPVPKSIRAAILRGLLPDPSERFVSVADLLAVLSYDRSAITRRWAAIGLVAACGGALWWQAQAPTPCTDLGAPVRAMWNEARRAELASAFAASGRPYAERAWTAIAERTDAWTAAWVAEATAACRATEIQRIQSTERLDLRVACLDQRRRQLGALLEVFARADDTAIERGPGAVERLPQPAGCADLQALDRRTPPPGDPAARANYDALVDQVAAARAEYATGHYARAKQLASDALDPALALAHRALEAEVRVVLGDSLDELGDTEASRRELAAAIGAAEAGGADEISARAWIGLAYLEAWRRNDTDAAERALGIAIGEIEALGDPLDLRGTATRAHAEILGTRGLFAEAEPIARTAIDELTRAEAGSFRVAAARLALGSLLADAGRWDEALAVIREAQSQFTAAVGPEHPSTLSARTNAANVLVRMRRLDEALREQLEVLALRERSLGAEHPTIAANLNSIASTYYHTERYELAVEYQRRAAALAERTRGAEHPDTLGIRENLASFLIESGATAEALALAEEVLRVRRRVQGPDHPDVAGNIDVVADALFNLDRNDEAAERYAEAIAIGERVLGPKHALMLDLWRGSAEVALARGRLDEARTAAARGLALADEHYGGGHIKSVAVLRTAAAAARAAGDVTEAEALARRADAIAARDATAAPP